jgi:hypothetical protein
MHCVRYRLVSDLGLGVNDAGKREEQIGRVKAKNDPRSLSWIDRMKLGK